MRTLALIVFLALAVGSFPMREANASGGVLPGNSCATPGQAIMSDDKLNIAACVYKTTGSTELIWKTMSNSKITCPTDQFLYAISNGQPKCSAPSYDFACDSGYALTGISGGRKQCTIIPINGVCGQANGGQKTSAPVSDACAAGNLSDMVNHNGNNGVGGWFGWTWSCVGIGGGTTDSCSAVVGDSTPCNSFRGRWAGTSCR
jgi:hypothetical protein